MKKLYTRDDPPEIPQSVIPCPICGDELHIIAITAWDKQGNVEDLILSCIFDNNKDHISLLYDDGWTPIEKRVTAWLNANYQLLPYTQDEELDRLAKWNAAARQFGKLKTA